MSATAVPAAAAVATESLTRRYGDVQAVDGLDLRVERGEVYGFLGLDGPARPPPSACCSA